MSLNIDPKSTTYCSYFCRLLVVVCLTNNFITFFKEVIMKHTAKVPDAQVKTRYFDQVRLSCIRKQQVLLGKGDTSIFKDIFRKF